MSKMKLFAVLSLFVILMTVFGSVYAQDNAPAFKVSSVVTDEKVVLTTKDFPADMAYTVAMGNPADPDNFTTVAKFNSKNGGSLNITVKIPEKFQGLNQINILLQDANGVKMPGSFTNIPEEEPAAEAPAEEPAEEPAAEEPAAEEKPAEEPAAEEAASDTTTTTQTESNEESGDAPVISLMNQEPAEKPAAEETAEQPAEEPAAEEPAEEPAAEEKPAEEPAEEPAAEEKPAEEPAAEEPAAEEAAEPEVLEPIQLANADSGAAAEEQDFTCDFSIIPTVHIDAVKRNETVTFTTQNFPAGKTFSVAMGVYVESWTPAPRPRPCMNCARPMPRPSKPGIPSGFPDVLSGEEPAKEPDKGPHYNHSVSFQGTEVGTFDSGNGEAQTLTFEIPANLAGVSPIAIWISDLGYCGYYSYNYFYNTTTNW